MAAALLSAALSGCQLPDRGDEMAVEYQYYGELLPALRASPLHQQLAIGTVTTTNHFAPRAPTRMDPERVRAALLESLHRTHLLAAPDKARYWLDVELQTTQAQQVVADLNVTATVHYTLRDAAGAIHFRDTLTSEYSIDVTDEPFRLSAWERAYIGAMRNNLTALLRALLETPSHPTPGMPTDDRPF